MTTVKKEGIATICANWKPDAICGFIFMVTHEVGEEQAARSFRWNTLDLEGTQCVKKWIPRAPDELIFTLFAP